MTQQPATPTDPTPAADTSTAPVPPVPLPAQEPKPEVGWVIAAFILFWPTAIPALFASQRASRALGAGDWITARAEGARARKFGIISVCIAGGLAVLYFVFLFLWIIAMIAFAANVDHEYGDHPWFSSHSRVERVEPEGSAPDRDLWFDDDYWYGDSSDSGPTFDGPRSPGGESAAPSPSDLPTPSDGATSTAPTTPNTP